MSLSPITPQAPGLWVCMFRTNEHPDAWHHTVAGSYDVIVECIEQAHTLGFTTVSTPVLLVDATVVTERLIKGSIDCAEMLCKTE